MLFICCVASAAFLFLLPCLPARAASPEAHPAVPAILSRAESLFLAMNVRDYPAIFAALSAKSRRTIVDDTIRASATAGEKPLPREEVAADFEAGGRVARDYWNAFLLRFDPNDPLERGRWEMGEVGKERAVILITNKGSNHPAALQMFFEEGAWKFGLVETFWSR